jgi:two-component system cell cycle response regulator CpdR
MGRILIVEDDDAVRTLAARALEREGHLIELATNGDNGLAKIIAAGGAFDLVITDIRMPGTDGIAMARAAAGRFPQMRFMFITGYADQRERTTGIAGVVDVLQKPFTLAEIRARAGRALALAPAP